PMPPRPRQAKTSSCGKCGASSSSEGGSDRGASAPVSTLSAVRLSFARHRTQRPSGASAATLAPQRGHSGWIEADAFMVHRSSIKSFVRVVTGQLETLVATQRRHHIAQLVLQVVPVGNGLRDLLAEQLAKPLAQPMDGGPCRAGADAERS